MARHVQRVEPGLPLGLPLLAEVTDHHADELARADVQRQDVRGGVEVPLDASCLGWQAELAAERGIARGREKRVARHPKPLHGERRDLAEHQALANGPSYLDAVAPAERGHDLAPRGV